MMFTMIMRQTIVVVLVTPTQTMSILTYSKQNKLVPHTVHLTDTVLDQDVVV